MELGQKGSSPWPFDFFEIFEIFFFFNFFDSIVLILFFF